MDAISRGCEAPDLPALPPVPRRIARRVAIGPEVPLARLKAAFHGDLTQRHALTRRFACLQEFR